MTSGLESTTARAPVRIAAVGDLMLGDSAICTGFGFASHYTEQQFVEAMAARRPLFGPADLVFGNLECSLSQHGHDPRLRMSTYLRGWPGYVEGLKAAGINVVSVANNHASQHGEEAFSETVAMLREAGIACCGIRGDDPWCSMPAIVEKNGRRLGFLGYCLRPRQYSPATPPYAEGDAETISGDVERLSSTVDHVIVSLHWGEEYVAHPAASEVELGQRVIDGGAVAVLGHHPHVPRPVQRYRRGLIAYSLGNIASDMIWYPPLRDSVLLTFELAEALEEVEVTPLRIGPDLLPAPVGPADAEAVVTEITGLDDADYRAEVSRTVREGRWAGYRYAAINAHRFRPPTFRQLVVSTARNKVAALFGQTGIAS